MKRILGSFKRKGSNHEAPTQVAPQGDSPESIVVREVIAFCESSAPNSPTAGDEFLHLPAIVDAAESSPSAAREGANSIRKILSKDYTSRPYAQYNAVMLIRILTDNPGRTFTRNFDTTFIKTVKELLREGHDLSVQQILRETLDSFETGKTDNETLMPLMGMWKKEKAKNNTKIYGNRAGPSVANGNAHGPPNAPSDGPPHVSQAGNHFAREHRQPRTLPPAAELAARIEEARTTAKLLSQTVQSTPAVEVPNNDLIKEFANRAASASRSIQGYIHTHNPAPDEDTLLTLIETNDQLSVAMSKHSRALLQARRALSNSSPKISTTTTTTTTTPPPPPPPSQAEQLNYAPPSGPPPKAIAGVQSHDHVNPVQRSTPQRTQDYAYNPLPNLTPHRRPLRQQQQPENNQDSPENPFADQPRQPSPPKQSYGLFGLANQAETTASARTTTSPRRDQSLLQTEEPLQPRDQNQMPAFPSTPSYAYGQDSAANNLSMQSASAPVPEQAQQGDPSDLQQRTGNMRI